MRPKVAQSKHRVFVSDQRSNQTDSLTLDVDTLTDTYPDGTTLPVCRRRWGDTDHRFCKAR